MKLKPTVTAEVGMKGQFRLELRRAGKVVRDTGWFDNLILDAGLDRLSNTATPAAINFCQVGTGSTTPANGQTALTTYVATNASRTTVSDSNTGSPNYYVEQIRQYTFTLGAVVANLAEVGVGWQSATGGLFSRALILDGGGSPTTLTVTVNDQLVVYYKISFRPRLTDAAGTLTLSAVGYAYNSRLANAGSFGASASNDLFSVQWGVVSSGNFELRGTGGILGAITSQPSGGTAVTTSLSSPSLAAYTSGNFYRDTTITLPAGTHNPTGGIVTMRIAFNMGLVWQWQFTPTAIPKDNTKQMVFGVRLSWARV